LVCCWVGRCCHHGCQLNFPIGLLHVSMDLLLESKESVDHSVGWVALGRCGGYGERGVGISLICWWVRFIIIIATDWCRSWQHGSVWGGRGHLSMTAAMVW